MRVLQPANKKGVACYSSCFLSAVNTAVLSVIHLASLSSLMLLYATVNYACKSRLSVHQLLLLLARVHRSQSLQLLCSCYAMLCYAMLCYAMLCYAMLCYAMLCYAMLCYAMLCYAMLCYAVAMLCYAMQLLCCFPAGIPSPIVSLSMIVSLRLPVPCHTK